MSSASPSELPEPVERVAAVLRAQAVDATIEEFPDGTPSAEEAARAAGCKLEQIVKSLVLVCDGAYVLALVPGDRRVEQRKVARLLGARDARIARADEVVEATGFEPGGVAPFPRRDVVAALMERTLLQHKRVWVGAGTPTHMARLAPGDLQALTGAQPADLVARG
jgi:Cys-tRNA(Pro) deacylase